MGEILVLAEHRLGALREVTFELTALASQLAADTGDAVTALVMGAGVDGFAAQLGGAVGRVLTMEAPELAEYNADTWLLGLVAVVAARRPRLTLIAHSACGMDLAPAAALRCGLPLASDCLAVRFEGEALAVERHVYGGKLHEHLTLEPADGYLATVRPGGAAGQTAAAADRATTVEAVAPPDWGERRGRRFVEIIEAVLEDVDIADAEVLVSVGRGLGKPENLPAVEALAAALGATLACSRPVADKGWLPKSRQVGTSGKAVRPKVYLALGISGAYQHVAGMRHADTIIAVNSDPAAPIFEVAHYGIVADMFEVLPVLQARLTTS